MNSVCNNVLFEMYRSLKKTVPVSEDAPEQADVEADDAESALMRTENTERLRQALHALPQKEQDLLRWWFLEERDKDEICRRLEIDRGYLRVLLFRARAKLRELLSRPLASAGVAHVDAVRRTSHRMTHQHAIDTHAAERYLLNEMPELERYTFEEHFFECEVCAEDMRVASQLRQEASTVFAGAPAARAARPARSRAAVTLPWAAAAVLAIGLVYGVQRAPGFGSATLVLAPVALRPATRGAVPTVTLPEGDAVVSLALEVNLPEGGAPLTYSLGRDDGEAEIASGRADAPAPGMPLIVVVPASRLSPGASHVIRVGRPDSQVPPLEYRFAVAAR